MTVLLPSAPVTCIVCPFRAEMIPSTSAPSGTPDRSPGGEPYTVVVVSAPTSSCCCADQPAVAGTPTKENRRINLEPLETAPISLLLLLRRPGLRDHRFSISQYRHLGALDCRSHYVLPGKICGL